MPFSEKIKDEVKRKAAFRCCRCQQVGVDVHHIIPTENGGSDDIDNAAPLCQNCHHQFGDNPKKRKEITKMRDWWYDTCSRMYSGKGYDEFAVLTEIDRKLELIQQGQPDLSDLKKQLKSLSDKLIDNMTPSSAGTVSSGIINASTATYLGPNVYANFHCPHCNATYGLLIGTDRCPQCHNKIT